jgi:YfiH family protein
MTDSQQHGGWPAPLPAQWIVPAWPVAERVRAFITTRSGGVSIGAWGDGSRGGMNVGAGTGDAAENIAQNRRLLNGYLPAPPRWLALQHGAEVVAAEAIGDAPVLADASTTRSARVVCCVTVADCLPVLLADRSGQAVGVAHGGWRSLAGGIVQAAVESMRSRADGPLDLVAYLGPCIGPGAFEVGGEVLQAMQRRLPDAGTAFRPLAAGKYLADLPALARQALTQVGVHDVLGGTWCTHSDPQRFYSFRRDRVTGRHAALIWLD